MLTSKFLSVDTKDLIKSLVATVLGAVWAIVAPTFIEVAKDPANAQLVFNWNEIWHTAVATGALYLGARFFAAQKEVYHVEK